MNRFAILLVALATLAGGVVFLATASRPAAAQDAKTQDGKAADAKAPDAKAQEAAPIFVTEIPPGYRDWKLVSVAHEEGDLKDIRAVLGNDAAIDAYRAGKLPFPEGAIIGRIAWSHVASEENNKSFGKEQSFVAGKPTKFYLQFMVKDSKKYAATGGWGYSSFDQDGKPSPESAMKTCFACHQMVSDRDFIFTRYSP